MSSNNSHQSNVATSVWKKPRKIPFQNEAALWLRSKASDKTERFHMNMRTLWVRWRAVLGFSILVIIGFIYIFAWKKSLPCPPSSPADSNLNAIWYYCNSPDIGQVLGQEGEVPKDKFNLEMVQVTIRHGDRFTLHSLPKYENPAISCDVEDFDHLSNHVPEMENFVSTMHKNADKLPKASQFFKFGLYPNAKECQPGHLTPDGAAQHVKNGAFLKKAYLDKWKLLNEDYKGQIRLVSTIRRRTFQSGVALLYGLLPQFDFSKLHISDALDSKMCTRTNPAYPCTCDSVTRFMDVIAGTFGQTLPKFTINKDLRNAYKQVADALGVGQKEVPRASHVMDVGIVHMCHRLKLPGMEKQCMASAALRTVVERINYNGQSQVQNLVYQQVSRMKMVPLLTEMVLNIEERLKSSSASRFVLYSGHDSTIDPLLTALNISDGMWPMYASRINVELYSTREDTVPGPKRYFIRVLYNGLDVTPKVVFCKGKTRPEWSDMCPLDHFRDFVKDPNIVKDLNLTSYKKACKKVILKN